MHNSERQFVELTCRQCEWAEDLDADDIAVRLRSIGRLRRDQQPEFDILFELLKSAAGDLPCPECESSGLTVVEATDDDWSAAVTCAACGKPIPAERLAALPGTKYCVACQRADESGADHAEPEFCPRCGALMELRPTTGAGITRYAMRCTGNPPCRT